MLLFTKPGCEKCDYVKQYIPSGAPVTTYNIETAEGLAELAYLGLVGVAEKEMPILYRSHDQRHFRGAIAVKNAFKEYC